MRVVTRLTGLSADVIRKWEQRYAAVRPKRTTGNTRRFTPQDVKRLTLLRQLTEKGHSIKDIASLPAQRLALLLARTGSAGDRGADPLRDEQFFQHVRREYLEAIGRFDSRAAAERITRAASLAPPDRFAMSVIGPLLQRIGELWSHGDTSVAQEHLVSAQLRGLIVAMLGWSVPQPGAPRIVLTTPDQHWHEFGVLIGALLAQGLGFEPVYLGPNLPEREMRMSVAQFKPELLVLSVVRDLTGQERFELAATLRRLAERVEVWLGVPEGHALAAEATDARLFHRYEDFQMALTQRRG